MNAYCKSPFSIYNFLCSLCLALIIVSCSNDEAKFKEGKKLAENHCASCHMAPSPSTLPSNVWANGVLPAMGIRMGKFGHGKVAYNDPKIQIGKSDLSQEDWEKIVRYYIKGSPKEIALSKEEVKKESDLFTTEVHSYESRKLTSMITMISFDKDKQHLLLGEAYSSYLVTVDLDGKILGGSPSNSPAVKIVKKDSLEYLLGIGSLRPSDESNGFMRINKDKIYGLTRPVDFLVEDVNKDGYDDFFVCNFGFTKGDFSLYKNLKNGTYEKEIIHPLSGAIKVEYKNMDEDDEKEVVVLFAQEHENLMIWDVEGDSFKGESILQFQPEYGVSDFQLTDIDNDGDNDIIISNGNNSDYSKILKDFHGVRIYLNEGNRKFTEVFYAPMHGVSKVEVEDFDLDGDLDILMISNFGNFSDPNFKSVQLLRNDGKLNFEVESIKDLPEYRWQTIDVVDYDTDGDLDVFIGAFAIDIGPKESDVSSRDEISWVKLENKIK